MKLTKVAIIPNDEIGMITLTPVRGKITVENAHVGTMTVDADDFDSLAYDLQRIGQSIERDLDDCIEEQKDETYEQTYYRICAD